MSEILTCVLCGRQGTGDFVTVPADPAMSGGGPRVRCRYRLDCQRRRAGAQHDANSPEESERPARVVEGEPGGGSDRYASVDALAGLAHELDELRRAIEASRGIPAQVEELARVVQALAEQVQAKAGRREPVAAPSWLDLPTGAPDVGISTAHAVLQDLVSWLGEVYLRYADAATDFPECWLWHPDVVEELLWLMYAWHAAYRDEAATAALAGDWHDRYRPGVVKRIRLAAGTCSLENHQPRPGQPDRSRPVVPLADALAPIAAWWATHREQAPPTPTEDQLRNRPTDGGAR